MFHHISTHDLTRRSTTSNLIQFDLFIFQLTTSQGGRPFGRIRSASTTSPFQLTTSQGGRRNDSRSYIREEHFNSRPHKEVDTELIQTLGELDISTHDLTRRSTMKIIKYGNRKLFQLTTSRGGRPFLTSSSLYFFSFQLTTSRGGRRYMNGLDGIPSVFQLTTSRGGRRVHRLLQSTREEFQLTTSRGGRPSFCSEKKPFRHFNSRPHEEVDMDGVTVCTI